MGFIVKKRVLRRVLRRGSEKGVSRRRPERPLGEYDPLGVRPIQCRLDECITDDSKSTLMYTPAGHDDR